MFNLFTRPTKDVAITPLKPFSTVTLEIASAQSNVDMVAQLQCKIAQLQEQVDFLTRKQQQLTYLYQQVDVERNQLYQFIATIAHELRNPLNVAKGFNSFLLQGKAGALSFKQEDFVASVATSLEQIHMLTEDLLCYNQIKAGQLDLELELIELKELVTESIRQFSLVAEAAQLELNLVDLTGTACYVRGDAMRLRQCFYNLLNNAIKFSPAGRQITVTIELFEDSYRVGITDQGPGISSENLKSIFQRFYQVKDKQGNHRTGYGLGLSISAELVKRHNGQIGVESSVGKGSCFWITLPQAMELAQPYQENLN